MFGVKDFELIMSDIRESPWTWLVAGGATLTSLYLLHSKVKARSSKKASKSKTVPPGTVILHQFQRGPFAPSFSPFPIKLETYLRLAKIPYVTETNENMSKKGKMPWMEYNGEEVADSHICITYLNQKLGIDLNKNLDPVQRATARAIQSLCEDHLYWALVCLRWLWDPERKLVKMFVKSPIVLWLVVRNLGNQAWGQGMSRHSRPEVKSFVLEDLQALTDFLGDKKFMMGDEITEVDCCVFGFLCQLIYHQKDEFFDGLVEARFPSLVQYKDRVKTLVWPDWDDISAGKETPLSGTLLEGRQ
ncbi:failed axon connections homolog [Aplysia californica]|uniref:Failed axon connections homolog n=1 Tax=Aplysia californica TaxID=6500 RepID=A0ABM0JD15_APLCA|nr:failed axon connections homolog [Aplysia californica]